MKKNNEKQALVFPGDERKVLLHSCCAPCSCSIMKTLKLNDIECTVFFYNPNIDTENEYSLRKEENIRFAQKLKIPFFDSDYFIGKTKWEEYIHGYENEPERGKRCSLCFKMRLNASAEFAYKNGFKVFTSSLGISRWKNFDEVCRCGLEAAEKYSNLIYWVHNWRKKGGNDRMSEISNTENFYRQKYCGCKYSKPSN